MSYVIMIDKRVKLPFYAGSCIALYMGWFLSQARDGLILKSVKQQELS